MSLCEICEAPGLSGAAWPWPGLTQRSGVQPHTPAERPQHVRLMSALVGSYMSEAQCSFLVGFFFPFCTSSFFTKSQVTAASQMRSLRKAV